MPVPTWAVGQVLAASDVNNWFVPVAAVKTSDQSVTSSTAFVSDTELFVPLVALGTYQFECFLSYEGAAGNNTGAIKWKWIVPAGTSVRYQGLFQGTGGGASVNGVFIAGDTPASNTQGPGVLTGVSMIGTIVVSSTGGNMTLQWAQNVSNATSTVVHPQSCLILRRIS